MTPNQEIASLKSQIESAFELHRAQQTTIATLREEVERLKDSNKHMVKELASAQLKIKELNKDDY